jgi:hypothetical protein
MKKTLVVAIMMVLGLSMTASALDPVTVDECSAVLQGEFQALMDTLNEAFEGALGEATALDLEGLGLTDYAKISLLAAAMCADEDLAAAFGENKETVDTGFTASLGALIAWAGNTATGDAITAAAGALDALKAIPGMSSIPGGPLYIALTTVLGKTPLEAAGIIAMIFDKATATLYGLPYLPDVLADLPGDLANVANPTKTYSLFYYFMTVATPNAVPAILSVSSELQANMIALLTSTLLTEAADYAAVLGTLGTLMGGLGMFAGSIDEDMAAAFTACAGVLGTGVTHLQGMVFPELPILGAIGKDVGEPFSALGDYDGDGVNNLTTYAAVVANGGGVPEFVAAASGANPFYPGNPLMPAAGLIGLAALVSAIAGGGAFVLRKK